MAEAVVEQRPPSVRFYCHRCNIEFEDLAQDLICPQCEGGFIERLESDPDDSSMSNFDDILSESDMAMDDTFDLSHPVASDIAMLMTGGRINRGVGGGAEALLQQFAWALAGGQSADGVSPLVLVGSPGDYVLGGEGLDAVVTQLLGQLEGSGPAPLPRDKIAAIPAVSVTREQVDARTQCSVCWDQFNLEEKVSQLLCSHMFHTACIEPWLKLHATCPICRHSLQADAPHSPPDGGIPTPAPAPPPTTNTNVEASMPTLSALLWRAGAGAGPPRRRRPARPSNNATSGWHATSAATHAAASPAPSSSGSAPTLFGNIFRAAINLSRPNSNSTQSNTSSNTSSNSSSNASSSSNSNSGSTSNSSTNMESGERDVSASDQRRSNTAGYIMDMDIDFD